MQFFAENFSNEPILHTDSKIFTILFIFYCPSYLISKVSLFKGSTPNYAELEYCSLREGNKWHDRDMYPTEY